MSLVARQQWLLIFLNHRRTLALSDNEPSPELTVGGDVYKAGIDGSVEAAFDRLVSEDGQFIGIQIWPEHSRAEGLLARVPNATYISRANDPPTLEVFFVDTDRERAEAQGGGEQSLVGRFYVSEHDGLAVAIDLTELLTSDGDYDVIKNADASWVMQGN
jgi:hypothetical protein